MFDLAELQTLPLPRCSHEHVSGPLPDSRLEPFLPPRLNATNDGVICVGCGEMLWRQGIVGFIMGQTFEWGLAHGEGFCSNCSYPARMYHRVDGGTIAFPLQYHPDDLRLTSEYHEYLPGR